MKVYAIIANGTEEVECLTFVDIMRRAEIDTVLVSVESSREVVSSHNVKITAEYTVEEVDFSDGDILFLPGGMPGAERIAANKKVMDTVFTYNSLKKRIVAICAAPAVVLGRNGLLKGKRAVCYPGLEKELIGSTLTLKGVVTDDNITTAIGLGYALNLALDIVDKVKGVEYGYKLRDAIQYKFN